MSCIDNILCPLAFDIFSPGEVIPIQWANNATGLPPSCATAPAPQVRLMLDLSDGRRSSNLLQRWPLYTPDGVQTLEDGSRTVQFPLPPDTDLQPGNTYFLRVGEDEVDTPPFAVVNGTAPAIDAAFAAACAADCCVDVQSPSDGQAFTPGDTVAVTWSAFGRGCGEKYSVDLMLDSSGGALDPAQQFIITPQPTRARVDASPHGAVTIALPPEDGVGGGTYYFSVTNTDARGRGFSVGASQYSPRFFTVGEVAAAAAADQRDPKSAWDKPAAAAVQKAAGAESGTSSGATSTVQQARRRRVWAALGAVVAGAVYAASVAL